MGEIIGSRVTDEGKIIFEMLMNQEESLQLKGHIKNIFSFSEDASNTNTNLSQRGKNGATKYFLIPRELRSNLKFNRKVKCQKFETEKKIVFIYMVDKI